MLPAITRRAGEARRTQRYTWHWESWLLRALMLAALVYQVATRNFGGAATLAEGVIVSLAPPLVQRFSRTHVPRLIELAFMLAIAVQFPSESFKLFEVYYYWDKIVHPAEIFLATFGFALLLLGYVDQYEVRMARPFAAAVAMLFGASLGTLWEFFEFISDWLKNTDLQKSNADTMTDIFANDAGAFVATLIAFWFYHHRRTSPRLREELGHLARWLTGGLGKLLDRRGGLVGALFVLAILALVAAFWLIDRRPPPLPPGLTAGQPQTWTFASGTLDAPNTDGAGGAVALLGGWLPGAYGEPGICRVNVEHPRPGSEKPGLIGLGPGTLYGAGGSGFIASARYFEERPPAGQGSQMTAGIAFGVRSPQDFYLLEASALHDFVRLDHFVHGRRRDLREKRVRTRGNEWHELQVRVEGGRVGAVLDGRPIFEQTRVAETAGGLGLWARASATACFSQASVAPLPPNSQG